MPRKAGCTTRNEAHTTIVKAATRAATMPGAIGDVHYMLMADLTMGGVGRSMPMPGPIMAGVDHSMLMPVLIMAGVDRSTPMPVPITVGADHTTHMPDPVGVGVGRSMPMPEDPIGAGVDH